MADLQLYPVQSFPPKLRTKDDRELIAKPLGQEAACSRCLIGRTIVGYLDRKTRKTWATCYECAELVARGEAPKPLDDSFVQYEE